MSDAKAAWVERVLGFVIPPPGAAGEKPRGMAGWQAARTAAMTTLKALETEVRKLEIPERDQAVILLRAIQANLTAAPATVQQVTELERYIATDDIIEDAEDPNGFGIKVELRTPLLAALADLKRETLGGAAP